MKRLALLLGLGFLVCTPMSAFAMSYSFQTSENFPRSTQTQWVGINNVLTGSVFETVGFCIDSTSAQVPKTPHLADLHIEGARSAFAAPATGVQPRLCDQV